MDAIQFMRHESVRIVALFFMISCAMGTAISQEVLVFGSSDEVGEWLQAENWWGEASRAEQLEVPRAIITGINPRWRQTAQQLTVAEKKEIFYRFMLPLVVHANEMVMERRTRLENERAELQTGGELTRDELGELSDAAVLLRILSREEAQSLPSSGTAVLDVIDEALYRLDVIPAGLVLGQAAYESGYGTSRFAIEGNALFGQWTFGGNGLVPEQQRASLGDHRIASYDWPFDSVRGYFLNLSSHPAYEDFRRLRAELKERKEPLSSLVLADGLIRYSERGQEYVDTLKGMIRVNGLAAADDAVFRDEPMRFIVVAGDAETASELREEIERMRAAGELANIVRRMRLE
jgi:uncharacterized FlgJ-related protein